LDKNQPSHYSVDFLVSSLYRRITTDSWCACKDIKLDANAAENNCHVQNRGVQQKRAFILPQKSAADAAPV
jgi:hypothetical protein